MGKGDTGETCAEAIRSQLRVGETKTFRELFENTRKLGNWKDDTIRQVLMSRVVNLPRHGTTGGVPFPSFS